MKKKKILCAAGVLCAAIWGVAVLGGCSSSEKVAPTEPARAYAMTAGSVALRSETLADAGISIRNVSGGRKTEASRISYVGNVGLRKAVEWSLSRSGIYEENGKYVLDVTLVEDGARREGEAFSVEETVLYILSERESGKRVFVETIVGGAQASAADAPLGARLRVAKERAMKMNIENFLAALDRAFLKAERAK